MTDFPPITLQSAVGRRGVRLPDRPELRELARAAVPTSLRRLSLPLPEVSELDVVRHFTRLSQRNYAIDLGLYPLGSCTMKYNPKVNDALAALPGFAHLHPLAPDEDAQGALNVMYSLGQRLCALTGMDAVSLQPAAGAQAELTALLMARAYAGDRGEARDTVLIPDSAHGTNPASARMAGLKIVTVPSDARGGVDLDTLDTCLGPHVLAFMLTNPSTLGLFEPQVLDISSRVHAAGGLMYLDGANYNAVVGIVDVSRMGFDLMHLNLHKTFSTPHGGGGPGAGPVLCSSALERYLPVPVVIKRGDQFMFDEDRPDSVGRVKAFQGNFGVLVRALAYLLSLGDAGLRDTARAAVLNANYTFARLREALDAPYPEGVMHEFVLSGKTLKKETGVTARDLAKRLLDYGFHAPTIYFPLLVEEALLIEIVETESKEAIDALCDALLQIIKEAHNAPELVKSAPLTTPVGRIDEAAAARTLLRDLAAQERNP
ncbi:aminomethyl-transferring glycine dehydrogenase subunit GcvPB [Deinococcus sp. QL22]|uniref:aminomethyl-transferring glycine dehydrogenase subunit GcvPB n=1 Tax=Deinococcus sp. QL22 TaxID=2939437 RepID=UPI002017D848|nr:aminomethyl-transferring glycine dehydrogenase subunit GcvPB [Deinococcus sp. QL22]UQN08149.1 aminomethyl-transferring glycine dehydrogenase subunit GcvPB [Deinococcus sp. QL22]